MIPSIVTRSDFVNTIIITNLGNGLFLCLRPILSLQSILILNSSTLFHLCRSGSSPSFPLPVPEWEITLFSCKHMEMQNSLHLQNWLEQLGPFRNREEEAIFNGQISVPSRVPVSLCCNLCKFPPLVWLVLVVRGGRIMSLVTTGNIGQNVGASACVISMGSGLVLLVLVQGGKGLVHNIWHSFNCFWWG